MKRVLSVLIGLAFLWLALQALAISQEEPPKTGDKKFDSYLKMMNEEAKGDPEGFFRRLSERHNVPEQDIRQAKEKHGLDFAETYMVTFLARRTNRNMNEVAEQYRLNKGKG